MGFLTNHSQTLDRQQPTEALKMPSKWRDIINHSLSSCFYSAGTLQCQVRRIFPSLCVKTERRIFISIFSRSLLALPFPVYDLFKFGLRFLSRRAAVTVTARLTALWGLPPWPPHFQSSRIITEAAMYIPPGCKWQYEGLLVSAEKWDARRQAWVRERVREREWEREVVKCMTVMEGDIIKVLFLAAEQLMQRCK